MMTMFDERERAFEQMFVHDEEMRFKARARRNRMIALWAAAQLGLRQSETDGYVRQTVETGVADDGDERVFRKIASDLGPLSSYWTESRLRLVMAEFMAKASTELRTHAG
jgi:hypothetical protein